MYENINTTGQTRGFSGRGGVYTYSSHKGYVWAELISGEKRKIPVSDVINKWREETGNILGIKDIQFTSSLFNSGEPINIQLTGLDFKDLNIVGDKIKDHLKNYIGIFNIKAFINIFIKGIKIF